MLRSRLPGEVRPIFPNSHARFLIAALSLAVLLWSSCAPERSAAPPAPAAEPNPATPWAGAQTDAPVAPAPDADERPVSSEPPRRIVFIGWDAASWKVITPLLLQGRLPNLQKLLRRSSYAVLETIDEMSPVLWTTIVTGKKNDLFVVPEAGLGDETWIQTARAVKHAQLWEMLPRQRFPMIGVFGLYYPPHPADGTEHVFVNPGNLGNRPADISGGCPFGRSWLDAGYDEIRCVSARVNYDASFALYSLTDKHAHRNYFFFDMAEREREGLVRVDPAFEERCRAGHDALVDAYVKADATLDAVVDDEQALIAVLSDHGIKHVGKHEEYLNFRAPFLRRSANRRRITTPRSRFV
ncbi:MAG: alkaline phosphatase family protein [Deltaproteobacteria bacterium]|nr:alkaline phosphatase family protein [Deltaproteobacteria bacterium]